MNDLLILAGVFCGTALVITLEFVRYSRSKRTVLDQNATMSQLKEDMHALCGGAINMGKHIDLLEQKMHRLAERQNQLELRDPVEQTYSHAIRLAQKGVNVDELMEISGLARGETELLLRIHRSQQGQKAALAE